jgi:hypothetical protein
MKQLKGIFFGLLAIISTQSFGQFQFDKDTLLIEGERIGFVSDLKSKEVNRINRNGTEMVGTVFTYEVSLFRPILENEKGVVISQINPTSSENLEVEFKEAFVLNTSEAKAGYSLYQAGVLRDRRNYFLLASAGVAGLGTYAQVRALEQYIENGQEPPTILRNAHFITLSLATALAIKSIFTDFQSNAKLKEAGIQLQKNQGPPQK